jgi:pimeloyl-ACP methyl ester carboxylesterase
MDPLPFRVHVPDDDLRDLHDRLRRTRRVRPLITGGGEDPAMLDRIERLTDYWRDGFDWRAQERRLNSVPQFRTEVDGVDLHFLHVRGNGPNPLPLLLTNGWPSSFVEYLGVLEPLAAAGFTVVAPALPGYGFSAWTPDRPLAGAQTAALFDQLMVSRLGYSRYVAHGDDVGGGVVNRLGMFHASSVLAIQTANWLNPSIPSPELSDEERAYTTADERWHADHGGYHHVQRTRPHTLAAGLNDSPAGLATWIAEKWLTWSDPATRYRITDDDLLTNVMIYWITQSIGSSMRTYALAKPVTAADRVVVPASVVVPKEPHLPAPPRSWLLRGYPRLMRVSYLEAGGHFIALEAPETLVAEITAAFAGFRDA